MAEAKQIIFTYKELAEMMVQKLSISEGLWGIYIRFGIAAGNAGPGPEELRPTAIVPVLEIGLQRFEEASNLTVDASDLAEGKRLSRVGRKRAKALASA